MNYSKAIKRTSLLGLFVVLIAIFSLAVNADSSEQSYASDTHIQGVSEFASEQAVSNSTKLESKPVSESEPLTAPSSNSTPPSEDSMLQMFLFAVIGGLILNIMPCVLPVLGMKLGSVISAKGLEKKQIRLQFISSALGILSSFWLIAGFLSLLKFSGSAVGWGIQFQSGWFIALMVLVTGLFGFNMLGLFDIRLSSSASTWMASKGDNSYRGHYLQGIFATLLATPCTAPFLGTAVAFALTTSIPTMIAIFSALGLGMALPWILVACFPSIALALPKAGPWMNKVKLIFAAMMLMTCLWLLTLLANHLPIFWVYVIGIAGFVSLVLRVLKIHGPKPTAWLGGGALSFVTLGMIVASLNADSWATPLPKDPDWVPLSTQAIDDYVADGRTVFVNVTADWCITCRANKIGVLLQNPVYDSLTNSTVVPMEGDWTVASDPITDYLRQNGRVGVPFNMVYGPATPEGIPLPIILSEEAVMSAIKLASGL